MRQLGPGDEIGGYRIEGIAGRGGMGIVYRARQERPARTVAIKVIAPDDIVHRYDDRSIVPVSPPLERSQLDRHRRADPETPGGKDLRGLSPRLAAGARVWVSHPGGKRPAVDDEREIVTIGFSELDEEQAQAEVERIRPQEQVRHDKIAEVVEPEMTRTFYVQVAQDDFTQAPPRE